MSDNESSNDELNEIVAEYEAKAAKKRTVNKTNKRSDDIGSSNDVQSEMEKVLFGDKKGLLRNLARSVGEKTEDEKIYDKSLNESSEEDEGSFDSKEKIQSEKSVKRKPAWVDSDDEDIQVGQIKKATRYTGSLDHLRKDQTYKEYLTDRFTRIVAQPKWASKDDGSKELNSDDEDLLHTVGFLAKPTKGSLPEHDIQVKRLKDLNRSTVAKNTDGPVTSIQFHPTSTAAMVACNNGLATIYSIDGVQNEKLHSMLFRRFPIKCAKLMPDGNRAVFGSVFPIYYHYDLMAAKEIRYVLPKTMKKNYNFQLSPCGRYMISADNSGSIYLLSVISNELIHTFHFGETVSGMCFTANSERIICNSRSCNVKIYSLRQERLEHAFIDDGCISGRTLHLSPNQRMLATGSNEGVVNVYDFEKLQLTKSPQPLKRFLNLRTPITDVKFNHTSELLAMCSKVAPNATKLAHFPTATVFANYPFSNNKLGNVRLMEFSPNSGYLALGCLNKEIPLLRLKHFSNY